MAQQFALHDDTPAYNPRYADAFVVFAVTVLSLAAGAWCLVRLDMALWAGSVVALAVYTVLLSVHLLVRRSLIAADGGGGEREHADLWMRAPLETPADEAAEPAADAPSSPHAEIARWAEAARAERETAGSDTPAPARSPDPFSFRPLQEPALPAGPGLSRLTDGDKWAPDARKPDETEPQVNVEQVLKKLADELNATPTVAPRVEKPAAASETEVMIGQSVAALQAAARSMAHSPASFEPASDEPTRRRAVVVAEAVHSCRRCRAARAGHAARARPAARADCRGRRGGAHGGAARADPRAGRGPGAPFRGEHAAAHRRRHRARAERVHARGARLRPDAAHRRRAHDARRARRPPARRARPAGLGAGGGGRRVADRRALRRCGLGRARPRGRHGPRARLRAERGARVHARSRRGARRTGCGRLQLRARGGDRPRHGLCRAQGDGLCLRRARCARVPGRPAGRAAGAFRPPTSAAISPISA